MTDHNQPIEHCEFVERTVIECYWLTVALLRWVIHVSIGTVPGLSGFLPEKGWEGVTVPGGRTANICLTVKDQPHLWVAL